MPPTVPTPDERGLVVFHVWNRCPYATRMGLSLGLIMLGLLLQTITLRFIPGLAFLLAGNLLLLVRGHNNLVDTRAFDADARWEPVPPDRLDRLVQLDRRMTRWDLTPWELTNPLGGFLGFLLASGLAVAAAASSGAIRILLLDLLVLLAPHWLTGVRRVMRQPNLLLKARLFRDLLDHQQNLLAPHRTQLVMLLHRQTGVPSDIKLKVDPAHAPRQFLGVYGQIVLNRVNGKPYPYFYVVLVAKPGVDLRRAVGTGRHNRIVLEHKSNPDAEVLVVRQATTKTSGYHTPPAIMADLLRLSLALTEQLFPSGAAQAA